MIPSVYNFNKFNYANALSFNNKVGKVKYYTCLMAYSLYAGRFTKRAHTHFSFNNVIIQVHIFGILKHTQIQLSKFFKFHLTSVR